jgi:hypothetical protein
MTRRVSLSLDFLAASATSKEILEQDPQLVREDLLAAIASARLEVQARRELWFSSGKPQLWVIEAGRSGQIECWGPEVAQHECLRHVIMYRDARY